MVSVSEHRAPFERRARLPVHAIAARYRDLGRARGRFDVATFDHPLEVQVIAPLFVDKGGTGAHLARGVDHRRQHLELDGDGIGEVFRLATGGRYADGDRLPDIAHFVGR